MQVADWCWAGDLFPENIDEYGIQQVTYDIGSHTTVVHPTSQYFVDLHSNSTSSFKMTLYNLAAAEATGRSVAFAPGSATEVLVMYPQPASVAASGGSGAASTPASPSTRCVPQYVAFATTDRKEVLFGALLLPDAAVFGPGPYPTVVK